MDIKWKVTTGIICSYGFFKEMKPSEPFLTPYLNSTYKHLSLEDLSSKVYPIWTYSYFVCLFFVFLITDRLRYKPLIVLESFAYLSTRVLLIWGNGVLAMQFMQIVYGLSTGTEIAYYSYIYALVPTQHYQKVTSYLRAAVLVGRFLAGLIGQLLISFKVTNYLVLNYISMSSVLMALILSLFLPMPKTTSGNVFVVQHESSTGDDVSHERASCVQSWKDSMFTLLRAFKKSYSNHTLLRWSIWWALATCGYLQIGNFVQNLWEEVQGPASKSKSLNGGVEAAGTLGGALVAFALSFMKVRWGRVGEFLLGGFSILDAVLLFIMARTTHIWIAYITYVCFRMSYAFLITIASFQVALNVGEHAFALIFGWNTFIALALQSLMTLIVADERGLDLSIRNQFLVYGGYYGGIAMIYLTVPLIHLIKYICNCCSRKKEEDVETETLSDVLDASHQNMKVDIQ